MWYILQVYSLQENKVLDFINLEIEDKPFKEDLEELIVPAQDTVQVRNGKRVHVKKKFLPGYLLLKGNLTADFLDFIQSVPGVSGFLSDGEGKPMPISEKEAQDVLDRMSSEYVKDVDNVAFNIGESIVIKEGPFMSFNGLVEYVDEDKKRLRVSVSIFGRATPVDLSYDQVSKIEKNA